MEYKLTDSSKPIQFVINKVKKIKTRPIQFKIFNKEINSKLHWSVNHNLNACLRFALRKKENYKLKCIQFDSI